MYYIIERDGKKECKKTTMPMPDKNNFIIGQHPFAFDGVGFAKAEEDFNAHLASLPSIECPQDLPLGVLVGWHDEKQWMGITSDFWNKCTESEYDTTKPEYRRHIMVKDEEEKQDPFIEKHLTAIKQKIKAATMELSKDWVSVDDRPLKQDDGEVIAFNEKWVDEDYNPSGVRIGFLNGDDKFYSAKWNNYQDFYSDDDEHLPTHYQRKPNSPKYKLEEIKGGFAHKPAADSDLEDKYPATPPEQHGEKMPIEHTQFPGTKGSSIDSVNDEAELSYMMKQENKEEESELSNALEWIVVVSSALKELVELKMIKDTDGKTEDYLKRQPLAWERAYETIRLLQKDAGYFKAVSRSAPTSEEAGGMREALKELVRLKDLKDELDEVPQEKQDQNFVNRYAEYSVGKKLAWKAARKLLSSPHPAEGSTEKTT